MRITQAHIDAFDSIYSRAAEDWDSIRNSHDYTDEEVQAVDLDFLRARTLRYEAAATLSRPTVTHTAIQGAGVLLAVAALLTAVLR